MLFSVIMNGWLENVDISFMEPRRAGRSLILINQQKDSKWSLTVRDTRDLIGLYSPSLTFIISIIS